MKKSILQNILRRLARTAIQKYKPTIVGITGSVGKTTAREAIFAVLNKKFFVWQNSENYNNEIGVPLAVLGITPQRNKLKLIFEILRSAFYAYIGDRKWYPTHLVLELAADRPGDIARLCEITRPKIAVVTAVGDVPVHVEHYESPEEVAHEKSYLVRQETQLVVLNTDDPIVARMRELAKAPVVSFGFSSEANYRASDPAYFMDGDRVGGLAFRVNFGESFLPIRLPAVIATHQIYGVVSALAVGAHLGMNLIDMSDALEALHIPHGRMELVRGMRHTIIINDSYNSSPLSLKAALDTLKEFPGKRKVAILGEMAELGIYAEQERRKADEHAKQCADVVLWCKTSDELLQGIAENIHQGWTYDTIWRTNGIETSRDWNTPEEIAQNAVTGWMNSPGHRENILRPVFRTEGIGVAVSAEGKVYVTEDFC